MSAAVFLFALPNSFSVVPMASGTFFMFCAPGQVFGESEGVGSHFHVLRNRTHYWRYRGRRVPFSCFPLPDSFSRVPRVSGLVLMFCAPGLAFGCTVGVGSGFHVLRARTRFGRYRRRQVPFSCLRSAARFRRCGGRQVPFSSFAPPNSFSAVPRASGPVLMFCARVLVFGCTEGVGSSFLFFALLDSFSAQPRTSAPVFMFCAPGLAFGGTEGVGSCTCYAFSGMFS
jgi:hypothetical protein